MGNVNFIKLSHEVLASKNFELGVHDPLDLSAVEELKPRELFVYLRAFLMGSLRIETDLLLIPISFTALKISTSSPAFSLFACTHKFSNSRVDILEENGKVMYLPYCYYNHHLGFRRV